MVHCEAISEAHSGEGGGAAPHDLGAGRRPSWPVDVTADARHDAVFAAGGREFDGVGVKCQGGASAGAAGTRGALP